MNLNQLLFYIFCLCFSVVAVLKLLFLIFCKIDWYFVVPSLCALQRNLKIMISMGLSAKKEKDDRFEQKKNEVVEMIKLQAPSMEYKV